jgi:hypothetical protein
MPINWNVEHFAKLRDAIDAKGITLEQAIDAINKVGVEKSCCTCKERTPGKKYDVYTNQCNTCNNFSKYEVKNG